MRFPQGFAEEVKNQSDIVRVVSDYVTLKKRGANHIACCPFHSEKTPSFNVHQSKGIFKCFGCNAGGDVLGFVMRIEGCSYPEAIRIVAEKSGIPIPVVNESEDYKKQAHEREVVLQLNEWAAEFFIGQLHAGEEGDRARDYVRARGLTEETCRAFKIGYAPDSWDALLNHLRDRGATTDEIHSSGLAILKEQGGLYDRFRGRVMFPITDSQNRVIAFGGRVMGDGEPKYLNSPETAIYTKGRHLFGLSQAKEELRQRGFAILVEGYLDCIIPSQEGIKNVVASLGTALTDSQVRLLRRYMEQPQVVVNFDSDAAGQAATMRSIEMLLAEGFKVNVLRIPAGKDPDEFVRTHGAKEFLGLLKKTQPYIEYIVDRAIDDNDISKPSGKVEAMNAILPHLARMRDRVARSDYASQIAKRMNLDSELIRQEWVKVAISGKKSFDPKRLQAALDLTVAERRLLELLLANAEVRRLIVPNLQPEDYEDLATRSIFESVIRLHSQDLEPNYHNLVELLPGEFESGLLPELLMSNLWWVSGSDFDTLYRWATHMLASVRRDRLERRLNAIQRDLEQASRDGDSETLNRLFLEKAEIKKRKLALSAPAEG